MAVSRTDLLNPEVLSLLGIKPLPRVDGLLKFCNGVNNSEIGVIIPASQ